MDEQALLYQARADLRVPSANERHKSSWAEQNMGRLFDLRQACKSKALQRWASVRGKISELGKNVRKQIQGDSRTLLYTANGKQRVWMTSSLMRHTKRIIRVGVTTGTMTIQRSFDWRSIESSTKSDLVKSRLWGTKFNSNVCLLLFQLSKVMRSEPFRQLMLLRWPAGTLSAQQ